MKKVLAASLAPLVLLTAPAAFAYSPSCTARISALQAQIDAASQAGNTGKLASLQSTMTKTKAKCTLEARDLHAGRKVRNGQREVLKAQDELSKADGELHDAQAAGDVKRISHAQRKVAEKQDKLREKTEELRSAQADLERLKG
ncbi:DUF1090 domain-containing protein [Trinickia terrae]|uniref:DUF1090 domain-containing protein n=1 Tax=Trinickia terrae TaxID=2571161 RepID=A0A4U1IBR8_9BURK|nr:DUF1090 family protein [Trinickia terrae]TKC91022.1 DUF1090 domain-containing protein [Trinickia terrae]